MLQIGSFVRVLEDTVSEEPLMEGMVGKVVADVYGRTDPAEQALVVIAGARKPCAVPLEAVEVISESDYGDDATQSRDLWRQRRGLWRERHGGPPRSNGGDGPTDTPSDTGVSVELSTAPAPREADVHLEAAEVIRRAEAVQPQELSAIAGPGLISILTEWSVGALDVLADDLPGFKKMPYGRARKVRNDHIERWLWDGLRLYLAVRSYHLMLPPITAEPGRDRVRALFERIDEGEAAERLSSFSLDVPAVKEALSLMATHWLNEALRGFARGLKQGDRVHEELAGYILQLLIVGYQVGFCADSANHFILAN
jgi:hypothetical protein